MRNMRAAMAVGVATVLLLATGPALAHHNSTINGARVSDSMYPTPNTWWSCTSGATPGCRTDNSQVTYFAEPSLTSTSRQNISSVLNNQFEPTDLSMIWQNPPAYTGSAETDIIFQMYDLPDNALGRTHCDDAISSELCDQQYVVFDNNSSNSGSSPHVACHEIGHGVGLQHGNRAYAETTNGDTELRCMVTPAVQSITTLGVHNVDQINRTW